MILSCFGRIHTRFCILALCDAMQQYYRENRILEGEEWEAFLGVLRTTPPTVVKINQSRPLWREVRATLESWPAWVCGVFIL